MASPRDLRRKPEKRQKGFAPVRFYLMLFVAYGDAVRARHPSVEFRIDKFLRLNRRIIIWGIIFGLVYVLRDFFALIFLTFLLVTFTMPVIEKMHTSMKIPRRLGATALYLVILLALVWLVLYIAPRITVEATGVANDLRTIDVQILKLKTQLALDYPKLEPLLNTYLTEEHVAEHLNRVRAIVAPKLVASARIALFAVTNTLLSLLFSYLIVLDFPRLTLEVEKLKNSKLREFFVEGTQPVVQFARVIARAFRAQAAIAVCNTILTLGGLLVLGIPQVALLTIIVFCFSFIPVLGVFISTAPIVIVALNSAGWSKVAAVIVMVVVVHAVESYILNPFIYGRELKVNPVLILIILFVGHHFFGLWGMLLGVPIAYYVMYHVIGVSRAEFDEPPVLPHPPPPGEPAPMA